VSHAPETLGLIAGNRSLPLVLAREARDAGVQRLVAAAFEKETDPHLEALVDEMEWLRVGQLGKLVEVFQKHGVTQCVMVGQIAPKNLFDLRPDLRALKLLTSLKEKNAHSIFGGIADELAKDGITLIEATPWLQPAMPQTGFRLGPEPDAALQADIEYGLRIAKKVSKLEIGQSVIIKEGYGPLPAARWGTGRKKWRRGGGEGGQGEPRFALRYSLPRRKDSGNLRLRRYSGDCL
jgi:hypothetical protein